MRSALALLLALGLASPPALADSLASLPDPSYAEDRPGDPERKAGRAIRALVYPSIGFPAIVEAGGLLTPKLRFVGSDRAKQDGANPAKDWQVLLRASRDPLPRTVACVVEAASWSAAEETWTLAARLPADLPRDVYDLEVHSAALPGGADRQPNAVRAIRAFREGFRFIHIADSQIHDLRTPDPTVVPLMLEQIRVLDPEFVVFSGDLNYGGDYDREYPDALRIFEESGLAVFMVPGNHDGYATVEPVPGPDGGAAGERRVRDGLDYWRAFFGPLYYSFDYGPRWHFTAINSYDGDPKRRNAKGPKPINYGGQVDPKQLAWIERDLLAAGEAGRRAAVLAHHDPRGSFKPNRDAFPWTWRKAADMSWHQTWNDAASRDRLLELTADTCVAWWFIGHKHNNALDRVRFHEGTPREKEVAFVRTTTMSCTAQADDMGFRILEALDGGIRSYNFAGPEQPHLPFGRPQHFRVEAKGPNDGSTPAATVRLVNLLQRDLPCTVELYVLPSESGYAVDGGRLRETARADNGAVVAWVEAVAPAGRKVDVTIRPAPKPGMKR